MEQGSETKTYGELRVVNDDKNPGRYQVVLKTGNMSHDFATHLAEHVEVGIREFLDCTGARGTLQKGFQRDGIDNIVETETIGEATPIDPKKLN